MGALQHFAPDVVGYNVMMASALGTQGNVITIKKNVPHRTDIAPIRRWRGHEPPTKKGDHPSVN